MSAPLHEIVHFLDAELRLREIPDEANAVNGLQLEASTQIRRVALAVDASEAAIEAACAAEAQLLIVHHGLLWGGNRPITGAHARKLARAFAGGLSLYSAHLPLDLHPTLGNNALLARALELAPCSGFGRYQGVEIGLMAECALSPGALEQRLLDVCGAVRRLGRGPEQVERVGVVSGSGAGYLGEASRRGLQALITGEAAHHAAIAADELGLHLFLCGHYRTERLGVRALGEALANKFDLQHSFFELDTGL